FGREGLDMAARWTTPDASSPTYKAMKMYRNYDANKSIFGDVSVSATGPNPDNLSVFAAERSVDGASGHGKNEKRDTLRRECGQPSTNCRDGGRANFRPSVSDRFFRWQQFVG